MKEKKAFWRVFLMSLKKNVIGLPGKIWRNPICLGVMAITGMIWGHFNWNFYWLFFVVLPVEMWLFERK